MHGEAAAGKSRPRGATTRLRRLATMVVVAAAGFLGACGDDDGVIDEAAESAGARAVAEAVRVSLLAQELPEGESYRTVTVLSEAVRDLPGEPEVRGIEDDDGDGLDDDGQLEVVVGDEVVCLSVGAQGDDIDVEDGACP